MAKPLKPFVRSGGYYPSAKYTPLVYPGGYTTLNAKNGKPEPSDPLNTFVGKIVRFLAKRSLPIVKLEANFTPIQDLNGYEAPWPAGGGKNKFPNVLPANTINAKIGSGSIQSAANARVFAIPCKTNTDYCFSQMSTGDGWIAAFGDKLPAVGDVVYSEKILINYTTYTMNSGTHTYILIHVSSEDVFAALNNSTFLTMIEEGTTRSATYSPYSNICPISGHTGCDIFDKAEYDAQATPTVSISFGQTVYGGTLTVNEDGSGLLTVDRVTDTFTKDSVWYAFSTGTGNSSAVVQLTEYQNCKYVDGASNRNGSIASTGKEAQNYWISARQNETGAITDMGFAYSSTGQLRFHRLDVANITDLASFKANFPDTQICYYLATPVTILLTASQINTLVDENNVWVDAATGDITVQAYGIPIGGSATSPMVGAGQAGHMII